jgi:NAD(P)-dependent dehydrogenase (short-subunit alcohol dehydrogenase family)
MSGLLNGGVAIVTGAASGIGRASAQAFAREGARGVIVADVDEAGGEGTVTMIRDAGGHAVFVGCDVSQESDVVGMVKAAGDTYGGLDYALNNAGIGIAKALLADVPVDDWDRSMAVNLRGVWLCMKYEIPEMLSRGKGAIVNTASIAGLGGFRLVSVYSAAKHGVIGLTKTAALEYAERGLRVNALCPGGTDTPLLARSIETVGTFLSSSGAPAPAGNWGQLQRWSAPEEQAEAALLLCSDRASYVTGVAFAVDGGRTAQ